MNPERTEAQSVPDRLIWLDVARVLCALMILGIHWLRAGFNVGLFGAGDPDNIVMDYQSHSGGLGIFRALLIAGTGPSASTWLSNFIGIFGAFGWEAVSALILISGFSLIIAQKNKRLDRASWLTWYRKRAKRILVPYYLVAIPCLVLYGIAFIAVRSTHGHAIATIIETKLLSQLHTPLLGVLTSHLLFFDPFSWQWGANFFAPAWWFIPAILLAYIAYPALRSLSRVSSGFPLLIFSAGISIVAYRLSNAGLLMNESWYYILLHQLFNFSLGIVLGNMWLNGARRPLERIVDSKRAFIAACLTFVVGNIVNWFPDFRPIASILYGPSLVLVIVFIARRLEKLRLAEKITAVDSYDLYLVHQPFAFPIALAAKLIVHSYGLFFGWFVFVAVAAAVARLLSLVQRPFLGLSGPRVKAPLWVRPPIATHQKRAS